MPAQKLLLFFFSFQIVFSVPASQQPCDSGEAGFMFEECPEKPMGSWHVPGNCCWWAVMGMWPCWTNQMKEKVFHFTMGESQFLSFSWPCSGKPVSIPVVAGHHSATKRKANLIYTEGVGLRGMPKGGTAAQLPVIWDNKFLALKSQL